MELILGYILMAALGVAVGIVFGAVPGMTATMAVAVFLPLTYAFDMNTALYLLLGLYVGGISGGLVSAILINIPGTPSSICTTFDGHPMARRGEAERALKIGIVSSLMGGIFSLICLWLLTPPLAKVAIKFGSVEKFLLILWAMTVIAALSKGSMTKGIFAGFLGVFIALIGEFTDNNMMRMVPGIFRRELRAGFQLLPALIGLFAVTQLFQEAESGMKATPLDDNVDLKSSRKFSMRDFKGQGVNVIRSAAIGTLMGILPGVGGSAASIMAYSQAKSFSKEPEKLGTGAVEGLVASESSNNGLTGGALVPLLSLGIPGDSTTAVLVGAFMLHGIQVGPLFISQNPDIWNTILIALLVCNLLMFAMMFYPLKWVAKIVKIPKMRVYPVVLLMCVVGAYATRSGVMFDIWSMLVFGILGYIFSKLKIPVAPFLIGFILGGDLETYFMDSLNGNDKSLLAFFTRPLGWAIWALIIVSVWYAVWDNRKGKKLEKAGMKD